MDADMQDAKFRSGALWGASLTAIGVGFMGRDRNWALIGLGALGLYLAKGGQLSADSIPRDLPQLPDVPGIKKLQELFPGGSAAIQDASTSASLAPNWSLNL